MVKTQIVIPNEEVSVIPLFYCGIAIYYDKYTFLQSFKKWWRFRANLIFRNFHCLIKDTTL